jgi:hypothetical protein
MPPPSHGHAPGAHGKGVCHAPHATGGGVSSPPPPAVVVAAAAAGRPCPDDRFLGSFSWG